MSITDTGMGIKSVGTVADGDEGSDGLDGATFSSCAALY